MDATEREIKPKEPPLRFRALDTADDLDFIAARETGGNLSEAIRLSIREKASRLREMGTAA